MNDREVAEARSYKVVKSNTLIRKARYDLSLSELKTFAFIVSKVKPGDKPFCKYKFTINEYCRVLGIDTNNGKNIQAVKASLKALVDKSFYLTQEDGGETSVSWVNKVWIHSGTGKITARLDEDMLQFITGLYKNFSEYELLCILPMRSVYSIRLFEVLKTYAHVGEHTFKIEDLKRMMGCEHYTRFPDFRRKALEVAVKEINRYSDLTATWETENYGRKITHITFHIHRRDPMERLEAATRASEQLDGQMSIFDFIEE